MAAPTRVIIIGAGWSGLAAAKTYLECSKALHRPIDLTVLDDSEAPGGVWTTQRLYPGLVANNPNGLYEFSDLSMVDDEHPHYESITGARVQAYLEAYARKFHVYDKIRFSVQVVKVRRRRQEQGDAEGRPHPSSSSSPSGWIVQTAIGELLECDKLIVAAGLHSVPKPLPLSSSTYTGTSIHSRDLGRVHERLSSDASVKDVVVVGGCKSAFEACSIFLATSSSPKRIHWVIRPSEQGAPLIVADPSKPVNLVAVANTRTFSTFSPSVFSTRGFWYRFLHSGSWLLGTWLLTAFWALMSRAIRRDAQYHRSRNGQKIEPKGKTLFFDTVYLSLVSKDHLFIEALHEDNPNKLTVIRSTPVRLEGREMVVVDEVNGAETRLPADAVIWCIGWTPGLDFFDPDEAADLGIPVALKAAPSTVDRTPTITITAPNSPTTNSQRKSSQPSTSFPPSDPYDDRIRSLFPTQLN